MTRIMYDSTNPYAIPVNAEMVAGYISPSPYAWTDNAWTRFPDAVKIRIAVRSYTDDGHALDVEQGDATPAESVDWVLMRRSSGADPTIYCSLSRWSTIINEFLQRNVPEPHWWVAHYNNVPEIPDGAVAVQYINPPQSGGNWDLSAVKDYWPGVDNIMLTQDDIKAIVDAIMNHNVPRQGPYSTGANADPNAPTMSVNDMLAFFANNTDNVRADVEAIKNALGGITLDILKVIVQEAVAQHIQVTGNVQIGPA